jgi:hypothetical protein
MANTYAQDQVQSAPAWLQGPFGAAFLAALGAQKDWLVSAAKQAVKARMPGYGGAPVTVANALLGQGDGSTTLFPLPGLATVAGLFIAGDWQGYRQLYPTPRTNVALQSEAPGNWTGNNYSVTANSTTAPDGSSAAASGRAAGTPASRRR